jgi:hypothetical protein
VRAVGLTVGGIAVVAMCAVGISDLPVVRSLSPLLAGLVVWVALAAVASVALAVSAGVLTRVCGAAVRFCAAGEETETIAVRIRDGYLVLEGWAYLDARRPGGSPRPRVLARRVLDFADAEGLRVYAAVATSATALRELYTTYGFEEVELHDVPLAARLPRALGARVDSLVRPVSSATLGR